MLANVLGNPVSSFLDYNGLPLQNGSIYIGQPNTDPTNPTNQIAVYQDSGLSIPLHQPIRTINGQPELNGSQIIVYLGLGVTSYALAVANAAGVIVASFPSVSPFSLGGSAAGSMVYKEFVAGVDFTAGTAPVLQLPSNFGSAANVFVDVDGVNQKPGIDYTVSGTTLTFVSAVPNGTLTINARGGITAAVGVPGNASVGPAQIQANSVGDGQLAWGNVLGRTCDSISALGNLNVAIYTRAFVTGYYAPNDGGGGPYYYSQGTPQASANGGTIIAAAGGVGCWLLQVIDTVSIRQFGAKGDGVTNDSAAIQAALNSGVAAVFVPMGTFLCSNLTVPLHVRFFGTQSMNSGIAPNLTQGSFLYSTDTVNPLITLSGGSSVENMGFWYPNQVTNATPIAYNWTIFIANTAANTLIQNCFFPNSYKAISTSVSNTSITIRNVWGYPLLYGILLDGGFDVTRIDNVMWSPNFNVNYSVGGGIPVLEAWVLANGIGIQINRQDTGRAFNCFVFGYFYAFVNNGTNAFTWEACAADGVCQPVLVEGGSHGITFNNCYFVALNPLNLTAVFDAITVNDSGVDIVITSCRIWGTTGNAINILSCGSAVISNNNFFQFGTQAGSSTIKAAVMCGASAAEVIATGNMIDGGSEGFTTGIYIGATVGGVFFDNNVIKNCAAEAWGIVVAGANNFTLLNNKYFNSAALSDASGAINKSISGTFVI